MLSDQVTFLAQGAAVDLGSLAAVGGPISAVSIIGTILVNAYLSGRKDKREQQAADVSTDSGIVDNAKKVLDLVNATADRMDKRVMELTAEAKSLREDNAALQRHINSQDDRIARQERDSEWLREDLKKARAEISELRNNSG